MESVFNLTTDQQADKDRYRDLVEFLEDLHTAGRTVMELQSGLIDELDELAKEHSGRASVMADNILCYEYQMCQPDPVKNDSEPFILSTGEKITDQTAGDLYVYPNPVRDKVLFEWDSLPSSAENLILTIINMEGKVVNIYPVYETSGYLLWNVGYAEPGIYLYSLSGSLNGKPQRLHEGKLFVR